MGNDKEETDDENFVLIVDSDMERSDKRNVFKIA